MNIAVNTRFLATDFAEGFSVYIREMMQRIVVAHPEHKFFFIYDREPAQPFIPATNVTTIIKGPAARHPVLWRWWYDISIPRVLKTINADLFISMDGMASLLTKTPQLLVIHDLAFLHYPSMYKKNHAGYYRRMTPAFIRKVKKLVTVSDFTAKDILSHYPFAKSKTEVIYNGVSDVFGPVDLERKEKVKQQFASGTEYFLYVGAIHPRKNLLNLLKAFSLFKKRQQSGMKLVIVGRLAWDTTSFTKSLSNYKYRDDVILTGYLGAEDLSNILSSAYAFVYPSLYEGFGLPVAEAMKAGVPVITSKGSAMEEIAGGAALLADPAEPSEIAAQMMQVYKDEKGRKALIEKGIERARRFNWDDAAASLWQCIQQAAANA